MAIELFPFCLQDPDYKIVLSAYPFVTQKLLREGDDDSFRAALNAILYPAGEDGVKQARPSPRRIAALINNALGRVAVTSDPSVMLDLDAMPSEEDAASLTESIAFLGSDRAGSIRKVLVDELVNGADLVLRSVTRRVAMSLQSTTSIPLPLPNIPFLPQPRLPLFNPISLVPEGIRTSSLDRIAPSLTPEEEIYAGDMLELTKTLTGLDVGELAVGFNSPRQLLSVFGPAIISLSQIAREGSNKLSTASALDGSDSSSKELLDLILPRRQSRSEPSLDPDMQLRLDARIALQSIAQEVVERLRTQQNSRLGFTE
jgi:hypothetical protein